jgi:hypothetical protein
MLLKFTTAPSDTLITSPLKSSGKIFGSSIYHAFILSLEVSIAMEISIGFDTSI